MPGALSKVTALQIDVDRAMTLTMKAKQELPPLPEAFSCIPNKDILGIIKACGFEECATHTDSDF